MASWHQVEPHRAHNPSRYPDYLVVEMYDASFLKRIQVTHPHYTCKYYTQLFGYTYISAWYKSEGIHSDGIDHVTSDTGHDYMV